MSTPLRCALIGTGGIAKWHARDFASKPDVVIAGLCDADRGAVDRFGADYPQARRYTSPEEMLREVQPDLVSIGTPNKFHCEAAVLALAAGAHVLCEKPMAMTVAEAEKMEAARAAAGRIGVINFSYRNNAAWRFVRELVATGELGRLFRVHAVYLQSFLGAEATPYAWRNDRELSGYGALGDLGVHMIDSVRYITGLDYERVVGLAQILVPHKLDRSGQPRPVTTDTNAAFLAELSGGTLAVFETTQCAPGYGNYFRIELSGEKGTVAVLSEKGDRFWTSGMGRAARYATWTTDIGEHVVPSDFNKQQSPPTPGAIIHAIRGEAIEYPTFADGVAAQRVLAAIEASQVNARWERAKGS